MTVTETVSISAAAAATGVSPHTLRYYERAGLIDPVGRAGSTHRRYTGAEIEWVVFLTKLRSTGMPIRRMREYADLVRRGEGTEVERLALHAISALQTEYSVWAREPEAEILPTLRELGIGFVPYSPLGRGFLTGTVRSLDDLEENDFRRYQPRFIGDNLAANIAIVEQIDALASAKGCTPAQVALAWVHAQGRDLAPIPGTKRRRYLEENIGALGVELTDDDLARLDDLGTARGDRYADMAPLNR
jgi:aryl-alcohol dehydrogenase-like predicted oxidoreductase